MKQVDKRPTEGQWVEVWQAKGKTWASTYKNDGGVIFVSTDSDHIHWIIDTHYGQNHCSTTSHDYLYFIAEPELKEITFKEDYELLKWLKDNAGKYLYSDETKSIRAYWIDTSSRGGYRLEDANSSVGYLINNIYLQQKTWYHY